MPYHKQNTVVALSIFLMAFMQGGCTKKNVDLSKEVSQGISAIQSKIGISLAPQVPSSSIQVGAPAWQKFNIGDRNIFKPLDSGNLSQEKVLVDAYQVQLKGIITIGRPKALFTVNGDKFLLGKGEFMKDILVQNVSENGVELQRSYKRVFLLVGEKQDI